MATKLREVEVIYYQYARICDRCGARSAYRDAVELPRVTAAAGWSHHGEHDLCPACVVTVPQTRKCESSTDDTDGHR